MDESDIEKRSLPRLSTVAIDLQAYNDQRKLFLDAYISFRQGHYANGRLALNYLTCMYHILPATRHFSQNEKEATDFLSNIDKLHIALNDFHSTHSNLNFSGTVIDPPLISQMDKVVRNFHKIMFECGYSR